MDGLDQLRLRSERSRQAAYAIPIVESREDALVLAAEVARQIERLPPAQRLLCLAQLEDVRAALGGRLDRLGEEAAETLRQAAAAARGGTACASYAAVGGRARRSGPTGAG